MNITGHTRVFPILGDPVTQVRAPELFNHLFSRHGIDAVLVPVHVKPASLEGFVRHALAAGNVGGLLLSIPHKTGAMPLLQHCDHLGRTAGAVNGIRAEPDGSFTGALFDGIGFVKALDHFGIPIDPRERLMVIGAGGGGIAIAVSLAARGAKRLVLFDALPGRAQAAAAKLRAAFDVEVETPAEADPSGCSLVINATPLGLRPGDPLPFEVKGLNRGAAVVDIIMTRQPTPLLQACRERGITAHPGYEMLLQQVPEYLEFFGYRELAAIVQHDPSEIRALLQPADSLTH